MKYIKIEKIIFSGRQNIDWDQVKEYMKRFQGKVYSVYKYQDNIQIDHMSTSEYTGSKYTWMLKGALAKVKANVVQIIPELIENAQNRRWIKNQSDKHGNNACKGWYRYDVFFEVPIHDSSGKVTRWNQYRGTLIVRINDIGLYLYDMVNIKKEASNPR